jgi:AraC family transcriptional regulator
MEERAEVRASERSALVTVRSTSRDRRWSGFVATLFDVTAGWVENAASQNHRIDMHVGAPVVARGRCGELVVSGMQVPGDINVVPAGYADSWERDASTTVLVVEISPELVRRAAEQLDGANFDGVVMHPQLQFQDPQLEHIGWALKAHLEADGPFERLYAESLGLALTAHLLRRYLRAVPADRTNNVAERRLRRVLEYIHGNMTFSLTLSELAQVANMSESQFKALFRERVGVPAHQYIIRSRVDYAMKLLLHTRMPISEVALQAGFADQSHLARCMRRLVGTTPKELRLHAL